VENVDSTYQNGWHNSFEVKVERKPQSCAFGFAGANYIFSARQANSENWYEIMTVHHDDLIEVSNKSVRVVNETTAYVFMGEKYAVTTDGGKKWMILQADKDLLLENFSKYQWISDVSLNEDGSGIMTVKAFDNNERWIELPFFTRDFGITWQEHNK
jgi:hypothetical protein